MKTLKFFFVIVLVSGFIPDTLVLCETGNLYAGAAKVNITPEEPVLMSGYTARKDPSMGVHDSLHARVLVLDVNGYRIAVISCDLIKYTNKHILDTARERFNIPHVLICSSHTHSGPEFGDYMSPVYDSPYARSVEKAMIDALDEAQENMFPARISAGYHHFPALGYNRLVMREDGHARAMFSDLERIPYGPVDPDIGVIKIEDENGNPRVVLMMYACHAVVNRINYEISADFPGAAARTVEEASGNNTICMFIQGGAGDINPMFMAPHRKGPYISPPEDYEFMEKMGAILGNEVIKAVKNLPSQENKKISLKAMCDSLKFRGRFNKELTYDIHITTVLINDEIALATFPGEPFVKHQLFWKENAEVPCPFFFGYTFSSGGFAPGYVPDIRSAAYGGYGADSSERLIEVGAGEAIMNRHLENLYRLGGIMRDKPGPN